MSAPHNAEKEYVGSVEVVAGRHEYQGGGLHLSVFGSLVIKLPLFLHPAFCFVFSSFDSCPLSV